MSKSLRGAPKAPPFLAQNTERMFNDSGRLSDSVSHTAKGAARKKCDLVDGIVAGERVHLHVPRSDVPSERNVELRIRAALAADGFVVWKHVVDPCWQCGKKPTKRAGLGEGMSDLFVIAPGDLGRCAFIEVKRPGYTKSDVRPMQRKRIAYLKRIGVVAGIATNEEEALALARKLRVRP